MPTVKIGNRELRVLHKSEPGSFLVEQKLVVARAELDQAGPAGYHEKMAGVILCYVGGHNEEVTLDWLLSNLPSDLTDIMRGCIIGSGHKPKVREAVKEPEAKDAKGEAARP